MKIKTNDKVEVIAGKEKGKTGKVIQIFPEDGRLVVEGLNTMTKHMRPRKAGEKGQKIQFFAPFSSSNVMVVCKNCGKKTRISYHRGKESDLAEKSGKKYRMCRKCQQSIDI
jgi:large subunit ribosomal protein L24